VTAKGVFTAHELNWPATSRPSYTTRSHGHACQRHDVIGCSETRTVSAQFSTCAVNVNTPLESMCSELQFGIVHELCTSLSRDGLQWRH